MADLQTLLGDSYKEEMTLDEVNAVLAERELVDKTQFEGFVPKTLLEKANSEAAEFKKKWKAAASEQEQKAMEEAEQKAAIEQELKDLRRSSKISEFEKQHITLGYDEKAAKEMAEALYDNDMDTVFRLQKIRNEEMQKTIKADLMKNMSIPPSGNQTNVDYSKQIAEAQAAGNQVLVASLIRQQAEANKPK